MWARQLAPLQIARPTSRASYPSFAGETTFGGWSARAPGEFARAERFDAIFFLDFPGREQKQAIWNIYLDLFEIDRDQKLPPDDNYTGAEIRACARLAALLEVPLIQAAQNVVPVAVTAAESVERLRTWANGRCLDADLGGIYQGNGTKPGAQRKVSRSPLSN